MAAGAAGTAIVAFEIVVAEGTSFAVEETCDVAEVTCAAVVAVATCDVVVAAVVAVAELVDIALLHSRGRHQVAAKTILTLFSLAAFEAEAMSSERVQEESFSVLQSRVRPESSSAD